MWIGRRLYWKQKGKENEDKHKMRKAIKSKLKCTEIEVKKKTDKHWTLLFVPSILHP